MKDNIPKDIDDWAKRIAGFVDESIVQEIMLGRKLTDAESKKIYQKTGNPTMEDLGYDPNE